MQVKPKLLTLLIAAGLASTSVSAEQWYVNPSIGHQAFDSKRDLDNTTTYSLGAEYRFDSRWAAELRLLDSNTDSKTESIDLTQYALDAIYYFQPATAQWQPYVSLGLGHADFDGKLSDNKETQINASLGARYLLSDRWSLRGEARGLFGLDDETQDSLISLGISYMFGGQSAPVATPEPAEKPEPVILDSDKDGVLDNKDLCPDTPSGRQVDDNGCKIPVLKDISLELSVNFANNSDAVQGEIANIDQIVELLKTYPELPIEIEGHTDSSGSEAYNKDLSQRRAEAVRDVLVKDHGISESRVTPVGYGEERPIASNETAEGKAANRRVTATLKHKIEE